MCKATAAVGGGKACNEVLHAGVAVNFMLRSLCWVIRLCKTCMLWNIAFGADLFLYDMMMMLLRPEMLYCIDEFVHAWVARACIASCVSGYVTL